MSDTLTESFPLTRNRDSSHQGGDKVRRWLIPYSDRLRQPHASLQAGMQDTGGLVEDTGHPVPGPPSRRKVPGTHGCHTAYQTQTRQFGRWLATNSIPPRVKASSPGNATVGAREGRLG